uniref:Uncharacterized protein n=1 Tax=Timema cristinae TaxID=61476 RepID=A0A7R9D917_TIMCR|nr:unnamed protein product [Timema cristinae]
MVRGCALDSGTLTTDTEIIRMSHCGGFFFDESKSPCGDMFAAARDHKQGHVAGYVKGCLQSCDDADACNSATRLGRITTMTLVLLGKKLFKVAMGSHHAPSYKELNDGLLVNYKQHVMSAMNTKRVATHTISTVGNLGIDYSVPAVNPECKKDSSTASARTQTNDIFLTPNCDLIISMLTRKFVFKDISTTLFNLSHLS